MTEILFIRHAETDLAGTFCGHSDPPVNQRGEEQIEQLVTTLDDSALDVIYSSDLRRAHTTAERIAIAMGAPVITVRALREIYFGDWEGLSWSDIESRDTAFASRWIAEYPDLPAPGGEGFADFQLRVLQAVAEIASAGYRRVAVVTHGGALRVVLQELFGVGSGEAWKLTKPFCSSFTYKVPTPRAVNR